jgi:WD40 repeat protein
MSPDGAAATCVATLAGHSGPVHYVAFDPSGRFVATGSWDNTAKVWRMLPDDAVCVATLAGHSDRVYSVAFDPTGRFMATGSEDNTAKIWNVVPSEGAVVYLKNLVDGRRGDLCYDFGSTPRPCLFCRF